jgi:hypothetical protein
METDDNGKMWVIRLRGSYYDTGVDMIVANIAAATRYIGIMEQPYEERGRKPNPEPIWPRYAKNGHRPKRKDWVWRFEWGEYTAEWEEVYQ